MHPLPYWPIDALPALQAAALASVCSFVCIRTKRLQQQQPADHRRTTGTRARPEEDALLFRVVWPRSFAYNACMSEAAGNHIGTLVQRSSTVA